MNGILKCSGTGAFKNIGDYIQSVAQEQFWEHKDCYVERETLNTFEAKESVNVIMNGWFMWAPDNFPPSPAINPLFISFHIVPEIAQKLLTDQSIKYLKNYEPIGARDTGTMNILKNNGVESYFSGCLTLTLGKKYQSNKKNDNIFFVDPYFEFGGKLKQNPLKKHFKAWWYYIKNRNKVKKILKNFNYEFSSLYRFWPSIEKKLMAASFYQSYSNFFSDDILQQAEFIQHNVKQIDFPTEESKIDYAKQLICKYATAKLVVTSRLHCGLPCLGLETPVIFVTSDALNGSSIRSAGRFGGLIDLFHVAKWVPNTVKASSKELEELSLNGKINLNTCLKNSTKYESLKNNLISTIEQWQKKQGIKV